MPRKPVVPSPNHPYHVTARCINRERFSLPLDIVWSIFEDYLYLIAIGYQVRIHCFVLMPNHFHLMVSTPQANLGQAMLYLLRETSREINRLSGRINQTYGGRYHKSLISSHHYFMCAYKYVYRNPVRAKLSHAVEDYPFSTLAGLCGRRRLLIPTVEDALLFTPGIDDRHISWLNTEPKAGHDEEMRLALKRPYFAFETPRKTGRESELKTTLL